MLCYYCSIGSLGNGGNEVKVENITVQRAHFFGTSNGARIKTYQVISKEYSFINRESSGKDLLSFLTTKISR